MDLHIKLAINGGTPVPTEPLPWELPGAHWMGQEEIDLVTSVIRAQSPFRYYNPRLKGMVDSWRKTFASESDLTLP